MTLMVTKNWPPGILCQTHLQVKRGEYVVVHAAGTDGIRNWLNGVQANGKQGWMPEDVLETPNEEIALAVHPHLFSENYTERSRMPSREYI